MLALLGPRAVRLAVLSRHRAHHAIMMRAMHVVTSIGAGAEAER